MWWFMTFYNEVDKKYWSMCGKMHPVTYAYIYKHRLVFYRPLTEEEVDEITKSGVDLYKVIF